MDIHRLRTIPFPPSAINCLAFSHPTGSSLGGQPLRLAIGRENGDIEIWDPANGSWICEITFRGGRERAVQGLAWVQDEDETDERGYTTHGRLRLFSIGYSSTVTEWDLCTGLPRRQSSGSHSEVWCLAAQPRLKRAKKGSMDLEARIEDGIYKGQNLVVGCADGTLVLLSTADDGLTFQKYIARASKKNARALSIRFKDRNTIVVGFSDSTIRVYDIRNGTLIRTMGLGAGAQGGPKEKLVWAVECLKNGDIVSADSSGEVVFWDGKTYGQLQRIKGHEADALCLAASQDGMRVFSGGMDRRTCVYKCTIKASNQRRNWVKTKHQRFHKHDVKAMAAFDSNKTMSFVVSGGLDTQPIIIPLREFGNEYHRALPFIPQDPPIASAKRMLVSWWENQITIWRIGRRKVEAADSEMIDGEPNYQTIAQLSLKGEENIASVTISPSGDLLAVATSAGIKAFSLEKQPDIPASHALKIKKLELPNSLASTGARMLQFSQDSKWLLFLRHDSTVHLARIAPSVDDQNSLTVLPTTIQLERPSGVRLGKDGKPYQNCLNGEWGSYDRTINRAAFSFDSRILALSDLGGNIDTFILEGNEDPAAPAIDIVSPTASAKSAASDSDDEDDLRTIVVYGQHWAPNPSTHLLPRLPSQALILSFRPGSQQQNLPLTNGNPGLHPTRHNPHAHSSALPSSSSTEPRLFIVTSQHNILEYNVLSGRLTDWSRRNIDTARLPEEFRLVRDRAIGCFWDIPDVSKQRTAYERVWVYGATWLAMFDLTQDLPSHKSSATSTHNGTNGTAITTSESDEQAVTQALVKSQPQSQKSLKRKLSTSADTKAAQRITTELAAKKGVTSGAGSRITKVGELGMGVAAAKVHRYGKDGKEVVTAMPRANVISLEDEDDDEDEAVDDDNDDDDAMDDITSSAIANGAIKNPNMPFYMTLRYRPMLGVLPLTPLDAWEARSGAEEMEVKYEPSDASLEVAIVERPVWDLELGERVVGKGDKDRSA